MLRSNPTRDNQAGRENEPAQVRGLRAPGLSFSNMHPFFCPPFLKKPPCQPNDSRWARLAGFGSGRFFRRIASATQPITLAGDLENLGIGQQTVEDRRRRRNVIH